MLNHSGQEVRILLENQGSFAMNRATKAFSSEGRNAPFVAFSLVRRARIGMPENDARYTCREYREEMVLLGLRRRLAQEDLSEEERRALRARLARLEAEMEMD
jgi:hypothetical protein